MERARLLSEAKESTGNWADRDSEAISARDSSLLKVGPVLCGQFPTTYVEDSGMQAKRSERGIRAE